MIEKPEYTNEMTRRNIDALNEVFGAVTLNKAEERSLIWLASGEPGTVTNLVSAVKRLKAGAK